MTRKIWRAAEVLRLRVPSSAQVGFVGSLLQKCSGLVTLSLRLERLGFLIGRFRSIGLFDDLVLMSLYDNEIN